MQWAKKTTADAVVILAFIQFVTVVQCRFHLCETLSSSDLSGKKSHVFDIRRKSRSRLQPAQTENARKYRWIFICWMCFVWNLLYADCVYTLYTLFNKTTYKQSQRDPRATEYISDLSSSRSQYHPCPPMVNNYTLFKTSPRNMWIMQSWISQSQLCKSHEIFKLRNPVHYIRDVTELCKWLHASIQCQWIAQYYNRSWKLEIT